MLGCPLSPVYVYIQLATVLYAHAAIPVSIEFRVTHIKAMLLSNLEALITNVIISGAVVVTWTSKVIVTIPVFFTLLLV